MRRWVSKLTLDQKLAGLALALGAVALFADVTPSRTAKVNVKELLTSVERQEDHVTPADLAAWIVEDRADYQLIDLRHPNAFSEYHIPTAQNVPLAQVTDGALARNEKLVLYGDGAVEASIVLKGQGYRSVFTLLGGLDAWKNEVLFPVMPQQATPEQRARFDRAAQLARFFGGQPRLAAAAGSEPQPMAMPAPSPAQVAAPTLPSGGAAVGPRKKKEGC